MSPAPEPPLVERLETGIAATVHQLDAVLADNRRLTDRVEVLQRDLQHWRCIALRAQHDLAQHQLRCPIEGTHP